MPYYNKILISQGKDEQHTGLDIFKSVTFVTSTFSKTETFFSSLIFAIDIMIFQYVQSR